MNFNCEIINITIYVPGSQGQRKEFKVSMFQSGKTFDIIFDDAGEIKYWYGSPSDLNALVKTIETVKGILGKHREI